jgi:hypothetical protein
MGREIGWVAGKRNSRPKESVKQEIIHNSVTEMISHEQ